MHSKVSQIFKIVKKIIIYIYNNNYYNLFNFYSVQGKCNIRLHCKHPPDLEYKSNQARILLTMV